MRGMIKLAAVFSTALMPLAGHAAQETPTLADECAVPANFDPPFTHVYDLRNGGKLVFIAVHHGSDPDDASHRLIGAALQQYKPSLVLVEGTASSRDSPAARKWLVNLASHRAQEGSVSENLFAVKLASDQGVRFLGWDFSPDEDYANSIGNGFEIADVIGAHLMRSKVNPFDSPADGDAIARETHYAARVQSAPAFDYAAWYRKNYGDRFDAANGTPCSGGVGGKIIKYESNRRNLNLVGLIARNARPGETLLVEAGANHWLALKDYLRSMSSHST